MQAFSLDRRLAAEFIGTAILLATVVGSGVMAETLSGGNVAIALLGNTIPTGAILYVLITMLGPVSGAHFNPAVTLAFSLHGDIAPRHAALYVAAQLAGGVVGVWLAHLMFDLTLLQISTKARFGAGQWVSEIVATAGLVLTIFATLRSRPEAIAQAVALFIVAAYWFTASTSFANPAVTIARALSDTFSGIRPQDVPAFIAAQIAGCILALALLRWLFAARRPA
ncbi:aquaporin [Rhizobium sp. C4]|uniref:aquaporin n=1 Tax=Rhizobium sp. C4 TaxID=1349800 RepID=UPI001E369B77|nr:MIP/aquaporin family protein [Rhizobium sp. C4]MCD2171689.1 aquaporin family protein [Rhizobium sp. C4]